MKAASVSGVVRHRWVCVPFSPGACGALAYCGRRSGGSPVAEWQVRRPAASGDSQARWRKRVV